MGAVRLPVALGKGARKEGMLHPTRSGIGAFAHLARLQQMAAAAANKWLT